MTSLWRKAVRWKNDSPLNEITLKNKVLFITGASRGIGREIALRSAQDGAKIIIASKTIEPHPKLPGTIFTVAEEVVKAGGKALPLRLDVRDDDQIESVVKQAVDHFGGIDILINNASAISLTPTLETPMKRFDLMMGVNMRATYASSKACIPHLRKRGNPHILNLSPPLIWIPSVRASFSLHDVKIWDEHVYSRNG